MEPWDTTAHDYPFKATCWNLLLKQLSISFKELPVMPIHLIL